MNKENLDALMAMNNKLNDQDTQLVVDRAKILSPAKEVEGTLVSFLTSRLNQISDQNDFLQTVEMHLRSRLTEASFEELLNLTHLLIEDNSKAAEGLLGLFKSPTSGKTILDNLRESETSTAAQVVYEDPSTDANVLQSMTYLTQILSQMGAKAGEAKDTPPKPKAKSK